MADHEQQDTADQAGTTEPAAKAPAKKAAKRAPRKKATPEPSTDAATTSAPAQAVAAEPPAEAAPAKKAAKKPAAKRTTKKVAAKKTETGPSVAEAVEATPPTENPAPATKKPAAKKTTAKKTAAKKTTTKKAAAKPVGEPVEEPTLLDEQAGSGEESGAPAVLFQAPEATKPATRTRKRPAAKVVPPEPAAQPDAEEAEDAEETQETADPSVVAAPDKTGDQTGNETGDEGAASEKPADRADAEETDDSDDDTEGSTGPRRRRRRGGRRRRKSGSGEGGGNAQGDRSGDQDGDQDGDRSAAGGDAGDAGDAGDQANGKGQGGSQDSDEQSEGGSSRRRRRRRREGDDKPGGGDDPSNTTTRVRKARSPEDEITAISGSTRLEAKKQRRRDGREAGRRRAPIVSEAEFLARRESVERTMVIRQREDLTQIGVLEDKVLVEHYVARESQTSLIGNIYLGRVQNVLPSMEAAFIDIGKGRNAVLYAGEVNWSALGHKDGAPRKIESVLSSGQTVLVQVTKDPIGHKGARLTSQISLAGRFLVYVPDGTTSGISRKLPDTERHRLKTLLKEIVPDTAGVIVRTAAEGASEDELTQDVERLKARWDDVEAKRKGSAPQLLYGEPDLTLKVVRDLFTEDFAQLVIQGEDAWDTVQAYVAHVAPDLQERLVKYDADEHRGADLFTTYRVEEQISKALDRKVWLPSGGSLVIDRTEAMTVVDVNTGKFTGSGGNLEETVTKNNLEAVEEVVRQLRLRDIGGIIVVDFIDMVLESNRDLVLRRLVECLGRDRTRHQVAEVTSLGLVQMTRKRIGTGLLEAFSENCPHCHGYGVVVHDRPVEPQGEDDEGRSNKRRGRGGRGRDDDHGGHQSSQGRQSGKDSSGDRGRKAPDQPAPKKPSPAEFAAMAQHEADEAAEAAQQAAGVAEQAAEVASVAEQAAEASASESRPTPRRSRRAQPASEPADRVAVEPAAAGSEPASDSVSKPASEQPAEPVATPEPSAAPKVVTRSRRGVSRTVATAAPAQPVEIVAPAPVAATAPEPPKVSTRTRGSRSGRPTGRGASVPKLDEASPTDGPTNGVVGEPAEDGRVEPTGRVEPGA